MARLKLGKGVSFFVKTQLRRLPQEDVDPKEAMLFRHNDQIRAARAEGSVKPDARSLGEGLVQSRD